MYFIELLEELNNLAYGRKRVADRHFDEEFERVYDELGFEFEEEAKERLSFLFEDCENIQLDKFCLLLKLEGEIVFTLWDAFDEGNDLLVLKGLKCKTINDSAEIITLKRDIEISMQMISMNKNSSWLDEDEKKRFIMKERKHLAKLRKQLKRKFAIANKDVIMFSNFVEAVKHIY